MSTSLEKERKALLERLDASRTNVREILSEHDERKHAPDVNTFPRTFPRSHTFKFLTQHPYYASLAVLVAVAALPRGSIRKAVKGSAALTAGILRTQAKTSLISHILPHIVHLIRPRKG